MSFHIPCTHAALPALTKPGRNVPKHPGRQARALLIAGAAALLKWAPVNLILGMAVSCSPLAVLQVCLSAPCPQLGQRYPSTSPAAWCEK